ncbi:MAG: zinc ribbon domain-containing protein [Lachnospiraceae bacterium]|jgi:hypothetical protein|nr:zinc ribbon domain-containing protein [Lachnospiraceae bacterium]
MENRVFCKNCGNDLSGTTGKFCSECGTAVGEAAHTPEQGAARSLNDYYKRLTEKIPILGRVLDPLIAFAKANRKASLVIAALVIVILVGAITTASGSRGGSSETSGANNSSSAARTPSVTVGEIMEFGGIEWRVLEVSGGKALLLSEYVLEYRPYNEKQEGVTWETSTLRAYLNVEFYNGFSASDRARIAPTMNNSNKDNQWFGTPGGNDTEDYIFLLSLEEVVRYFGDSGQLANRPSEDVWTIDDQYNEARIAYDLDGSTRWWWLRSPGWLRGDAAQVLNNGSISVVGVTASYVYDDNYWNGAVRPALWLNL